MIALTNEYKLALQAFLSNPDTKTSRGDLATASYKVFQHLVVDAGIDEPDVYMPVLADFLKSCSLEILKVSELTAKKLSDFVRDLAHSDDDRVILAFHLLNMNHQYYFNENFVFPPEEAMRLQVFAFQMAAAKIEQREEIAQTTMDAARLLMQFVDQHFSLLPEKQKLNYPNFVRSVSGVCMEIKDALQQEINLKTITYNMLGAVIGLGIFYGIYLMATATKRHSFFLQTDQCRALQKAIDVITKVQKEIASDISLERDEEESAPFLSTSLIFAV